MDIKAAIADEFDRRVSAFHAEPRLRVWSLVITFLGDAVVPRGGRAALSDIQAVMERLGIESGAVRTAMSRLAADGWVTREREGRLSFYQLATAGRHAFDEATRRIYAEGLPAWDGVWTVIIAPAPIAAADAEALVGEGFVRIGQQAFLKPGPLNDKALAEGRLTVRGKGSDLPETFAGFWGLEDLAGRYRTFMALWSQLAERLAAGDRLAPLDAMAARTLLIHDWRRLVLRDPGLPGVLLPDGWPGEPARLVARRVYAPLVPASEAWLDDQGLAPQRDPVSFAQRFGIQPPISEMID
ncbi:MAG: PaaX family transcriptional regulator C-terminal domain-containing protein [Zhengella sp.]|uniref:PaaX family transcriptional regulator n=1 Tax=Zhengella sp. TaxID=2282762 RepID=UPI001D28BA2A|nr:phenylacetic acid degradation protein [Notoacmeibacter sp.]MCC0026903.1 phenylacetic acid degradation protein [Brucellaceae bacterium]